MLVLTCTTPEYCSGRILRRQATIAAREAEEASKPVTATAKSQMQFKKPQPMKPAILGNARHAASVREELPHSTGATSTLEKMPPGIIGNMPAALSQTTGNDRKTNLAEKDSITAKQVKVSDTINRMAASNKEFENVNVTRPIQSSLPIVGAVKTTSTKAGPKTPFTKTKATDTAPETEPEKPKLKKMVQKKISLEQAVSELELNTEEVPKNVCIIAFFSIIRIRIFKMSI